MAVATGHFRTTAGRKDRPATVDVPRFVHDHFVALEGLALLLMIGGAIEAYNFLHQENSASRVALLNSPNQPRISLVSPNQEEPLPPVRSYSDQDIEKMVTSPGAVSGANAIMFDERSGTDVPVRIDGADYSSPGKVNVVFEVSGKKTSLLTSPDQLIFPTAPLKDWVPADATDLPESSSVIRTMKEVDFGINWINKLYAENGVADHVSPIEDTRITWQPAGEPRTQISCDLDGKTCTSNQPLIVYGEPVRNAQGYAFDINGKAYVYLDYQSDLVKVKQIVDELHEQTHTTQAKRGIYTQYYATNKFLNEALETYTQAIAVQALGQYRGRSAGMDAVINKYDYPENLNLKWFDRIVKDLNAKGVKGISKILDFGARGDMVGLQNLYDQYYGQGSFVKIYSDLPRN